MGAHWISASAQVRSLAKAVATAFAAAPLTDEERWPGKVEVTDLPWQAPPLESNLMLGGAPLSSYLNVPMDIDSRRVMQFWQRTLQDMWHRPSNCMRRGVYAGCGMAFPRLKLGQRALVFSTPAGYPSLLDPLAGAQFTVELVHLLATSLPVKDLVSNESDYYLDTEQGERIGIRAGEIIIDSPWRTNVAGLIPDLLEMPRGHANYACQFDTLALVRSILHVNRRVFPRNFDALDTALQALRLLSMGGHCPELVTEMQMSSLDREEQKQREQILRDALEVFDANMSDRERLRVWYAQLVPALLTPSGFKRAIFGGAQFPFALSQDKLAAIRSWLEKQYKELPEAIRTLTLEEA